MITPKGFIKSKIMKRVFYLLGLLFLLSCSKSSTNSSSSSGLITMKTASGTSFSSSNITRILQTTTGVFFFNADPFDTYRKFYFFSELKMYLKFGRSLVNIKKIEHQFRKFSAYSGCACTKSTNICENNNARINLKPTESIISSCFSSRRNFSVSGFRFQDLGGESSAAVNSILTESIEASSSLTISEKISSESIYKTLYYLK